MTRRPSVWAAENIECPECRARAGFPCEDPPRRGDRRQTWVPGTGRPRAPHIARQRAFAARQGGAT
jgi:hypothetical protein